MDKQFWPKEFWATNFGLDIEALKSSRLPLTGGPQIGNYACLPNAERIFVIFFMSF